MTKVKQRVGLAINVMLDQVQFTLSDIQLVSFPNPKRRRLTLAQRAARMGWSKPRLKQVWG